MGITNFINLFGGLGLFLFGMKYMSEGLNKVAGNKMKNLLEKLTRNRFKGFFLGVLVTAIIQSSSATTVMLMGFLNAGIMDLAQATGVIIGANIGTTITAVLIAIDVSFIAPVCIFIGAAMALFSKKQTKQFVGQIILGFGILFFGLKYMSGDAAMGVLKTSEAFQSFITQANNPFLGLLIGIAICAVLQSSSAAIGILQILVLNGLMPIDFAMYIIIGVNVGSAMPLFLSAIGAKTNAKRAALIYFIFDLMGMFIFMPVAMFTPYTDWLATVSSNGSVQVAAGHIIFKVVTALVLLPFVPVIVRISEKLIKSKEHETELRFTYIDKNLADVSVSTIIQVNKEVERMALLVRENFVAACEGFARYEVADPQKIKDNEVLINWLNHHISDYMVTLATSRITADDSEHIGKLFHVITDLERIGDHAVNILERTEQVNSENLNFSDDGINEFRKIYEISLEEFDRSMGAFKNNKLTDEDEHYIHALENKVDELTLEAQDNHVERLRQKKCHTDSGVVFTKVLQDLERVGDHSYNIAWAARKDKDLIRQI